MAIDQLFEEVVGNVKQLHVIAEPSENAIGSVDISSIAPSEAHLGQFGGESVLLDVKLELSTSGYQPGDVLVEPQEIPGAMRTESGCGVLQSVELTSDQAGALDIVIFSERVELGEVGEPVNLSAADATKKLGVIEITSSDYTDFGASRSVTIPNVGIGVKSGADSTSIFVGVVARGENIGSANGLFLKVYILQD